MACWAASCSVSWRLIRVTNFRSQLLRLADSALSFSISILFWSALCKLKVRGLVRTAKRCQILCASSRRRYLCSGTSLSLLQTHAPAGLWVSRANTDISQRQLLPPKKVSISDKRPANFSPPRHRVWRTWAAHLAAFGKVDHHGSNLTQLFLVTAAESANNPRKNVLQMWAVAMVQDLRDIAEVSVNWRPPILSTMKNW